MEDHSKTEAMIILFRTFIFLYLYQRYNYNSQYQYSSSCQDTGKPFASYTGYTRLMSKNYCQAPMFLWLVRENRTQSNLNTPLPGGVCLSLRNWSTHCAPGARHSNLKNLKVARPGHFLFPNGQGCKCLPCSFKAVLWNIICLLPDSTFS